MHKKLLPIFFLVVLTATAAYLLGHHTGDQEACRAWMFRSHYPSRQMLPYAITALRTKDSRFWKPYTVFRQNLPGSLARILPDWREPRRLRLDAAEWFLNVDTRGFEAAVPALCQAADHDPDLRVRRAAITALAAMGGYSHEVVPIMLRALNDPYEQTRQAACEWIGKTQPDPEKFVPVLVQALENPEFRTLCADALGAYGPRARFALEPLQRLARTNDPAISSLAIWALGKIDPKVPASPEVK